MKSSCLLILLTVCMPLCGYAQNWSKEDSVWLSDVLSGKDTIRINPEFQKAILEGTFINPEDEPGQQILSAPSELPLLKDFSEYLHADTDSVHNKLDYKSMPPSVYRLYVIELDTGMSVNKNAYTRSPIPFIEKKEIKVGKLPVTVAAGGRNLYDSDIVKDGQKRGTLTGTAKLYFSLDDILLFIFSKKERNKRKNRKRDDTWRYYNSMP